MGDTKMTKYERKLRRKDWANRVLSVVLSFAMVMSSTPLPAGAVGEDDAAAAAQPTAAEVQAQQEQAATEASVSLNLSHAYLTVSGQTVGDVTKSLTVPTTKDLAFTVAADSGYEVSEVYTSKDGTKTSLGTAAGNYTIPAASLADGLAVCVTTTELPQATQEESTATPLAKEESSDKAAEADAAKTSDAGESEAEATADQPATDQPAEEAAPTKTTYTYEDDQVSVTATLQDPAAVPDDAQFKVTPVTQGSTDYNYDAYMDALNKAAEGDADKTYTSDNTLLYDVAFMVPKTDEAGNAIAGEWVEYEPTAGSVDIQISFKQSQLTDGIDAQSSDDVEVKHLPLTDAVRDATDSTADATNISASDVQVEDVQKADVSTEGEQAVSITTDSLSVMALSVHRAAANIGFRAVGGQLTYDQILGNARYFGIVADKWYQAEAETNAAVKTLYTNGPQSGNDLTAGNDHQPWFIGQMGSYGISWESNKENLTEHVPPADGMTLQIKGRNSDVYTPSDNFPYLWSNETINFHNATQDAVNSYVGSMLTDMSGKSTTYAGRSSLSGSLPMPVTDQSDPNHMTTNYVLDFTTSGAGTYYVDVTSIYDQLNDSGLKIKANSNQTIVLNVTKTDAVTLKKFTMTIDGRDVDSASTNAGGEAVATHLVWNVPNAREVNIGGSILGMVIAPNAMVRVNDTSAGWVIANAVRSGSGEWHNVWQSYDQNYTKISTTAQVTKVLEGGTLQAGQFTFVLADSQDNQVATATNDASGNVTFGDITYDQPGTYTYKIYEQIPSDATNASGVSYANATDDQKSAGGFAKDGITYDSTVHTMVVKVEHRAGSSDAIRGALIATTTFDNGTATGVTFTNSKAQSTTARVQVQKKLSTGATPAADAYEFQLIDAAGTVVQTKTNDGEGLVSFDPITYTAAGTYTYTIHESSTAKQGWTNASDKTATVTVSSKNGGLVASVAYSDGSNVMTNTAAAGFSVWGSKTLLGGTLGAGQYTFDLKDADGNLVATTTNGNENGVGSFVLSSPADYIRTAGTWDFKVTERIPDDATNAAGTRWDQASDTERAAGGFTKDGVVYDSSTKTVRVTSSLDANGALTASASVVGGSLAFTNISAEKTSVSVTKTWVDDSNRDGVRPASVTVRLWADGTEVKHQAVGGTGDTWSYTFADLPKYDPTDGHEIAYTVTEDPVGQYTSTVDGYGITNTHKTEKTSVTVSKVWVGPATGPVTVRLYADGVDTGKTLTLTATGADGQLGTKDDWKGTFADLAKYKNDGTGAREIAYTVQEENVPAGYTATTGTAANGYTITNTNTETTGVTITKVWEDSSNQDGVRPSAADFADKVSLSSDAAGLDLSAYKPTVTDNGNGTYTVAYTNLPKYHGGKLVTYTVSESRVAGYTAKDGATSATNGGTITNTHTTQKTRVPVTKTWVGPVPASVSSVTVELVKNGTPTGTKLELNADNGWSGAFEDLPAKEGGQDIVYTVREVSTPANSELVGITGSPVVGFTITNRNAEKTSVSGTKTWSGDSEAVRPQSVTVNLLADGTKVDSKTVTAQGGWSYTFDNLDKYDQADGHEIAYTVTENAVDKYTATIDGYDITNTYRPGLTSVTVTKAWEDGNDQDGIRPESIQVQLKAGDAAQGDVVTLNADNHWTHTWTNLDQKDAKGSEIQYSVQEVNVPAGYSVAVSGDMAQGYTLTNTHQTETTDVSVTKAWEDSNNQDGIRPSAEEFASRLTLTADQAVPGLNDFIPMVTDKGDGTYAVAYSGLPKYVQGQEVHYTVTESAVDGYTTKSASATNGGTITNTHETEKVSVPVTKSWVGPATADSVTVRLLADDTDTGRTLTLTADKGWKGSFDNLAKYRNDGTGAREITYTVSEDEGSSYSAAIAGSAATGFTVTNTNTETTSLTGCKVWVDDNDRDGLRPQSVTVRLLANGVAATDAAGQVIQATATAADGWAYSFTGLPKYDATSGQPISYSVQEVDTPKGYTAATSATTTGADLFNTHQVETTSVSVTKAWNDSGNQDGIRPDSVQVQLYADGAAVAGKVATLSEANGWKATFSDLPANRDKGAAIAYTVQEVGTTTGYSATTGDSSNGYTVTNTHQAETKDVSITKVWDDNGNQDGIRPAADQFAALVSLTSDAEGQDLTGYAPTVIDNGDGTYTVTYKGLPKFQNGKEVTYTIHEGAVEGYGARDGATSATDGGTITNAHQTETTQVSITKVWEDGNNQDGIRPSPDDFASHVTLGSSAEGQDLSSYTPTVTDNGDGTYTVAYSGLPKFQGGSEVTYTLVETAVDGYTSAGSVTAIPDGATITNAHAPQVTDISVTKAWDDSDNQDGIRPGSVDVQLYADDEPVEGQVVTLSSVNDWKATFTGLPVNKDGKAIAYTVKERTVTDGYQATTTGDLAGGFTITNRHETEKVSIPVTKDWKGKVGSAVTIRLLADGSDTGRTVELNEANGWKASFNDLDAYQAGSRIDYTVEEEDVQTGYTAEVTGTAQDGFTVTNTFAPAPTSITLTATKALTGNQALAGDDYAFELLRADGTQLTSARNAADGTVTFPAITYTIDDLKQDDGSYADSKTFSYTMREVVPGSATNAEGILYADATDEQKAAGGFRTTSVSADGQPTYVTYDTTEHPVTVTLTCQDGVLTAATDADYVAPTFTNYAFAASASLTFDKHYYGTDDRAFTFTFETANADWASREDTGSTAYSPNGTWFDDGEQHYVKTDLTTGDYVDGVSTVGLPTIQYAKPGTYYYVLKENKADEGDPHDDTQFLITVTVAQDGTATATYQSRYGDEGDVQAADSLAFYNNAMVMSVGYRALALAASRPSTSGVTVQPLVKKVLVNGDNDVSTGNVSMEANAFKFRITDDQTGRVLETVGNASDGQVAFGKIYYTKEDLKVADGKYASEKTFTYTIDEVDTGDDSIVYDSGKITMSVTVSLVNDRVTVTKPTYSKSNAVEGIDSNVFVNRTKTVKVRNRKVSRDEQGNPTNEGLVDGVYGLWMVGSNGSQDVYLGNKKSDANGYMVFDVPITEGNVYYFQEEKAPAGHLVDPYPSRKFELVKNESGKYEIHYLDN